MKLTLTTKAWERSHPGKARGHGLWCLQQTTGRTALESERSGEVLELTGTLTEVRAEMARRGLGGLWAVLP